MLPADPLRFMVFRTDKGSLDKGGLPQPAFLNFNVKLLYPPAHPMQVQTRLDTDGYQEVSAVLWPSIYPDVHQPCCLEIGLA